MKKSTLFLHFLSLTFIQNYAMEMVCTVENLDDYQALCGIIRRQQEQKLQKFKEKLPSHNNISQKKTKLELKIEKIKKDLEASQAHQILNFKARFNIDGTTWRNCADITDKKCKLDDASDIPSLNATNNAT